MQILGHIIIRIFAELTARLFALEVVQEAKEVDPVATAKALSALGAILILGMGGVLMISMSGRWVRRWIFSKRMSGVLASADAQTGKLNWAKAAKIETNIDDSIGCNSMDADR